MGEEGEGEREREEEGGKRKGGKDGGGGGGREGERGGRVRGDSVTSRPDIKKPRSEKDEINVPMALSVFRDGVVKAAKLLLLLI